MKKTHSPAAQRRRSTLRPIHLYMLTPRHTIRRHISLHLPAPDHSPMPPEIENCFEIPALFAVSRFQNRKPGQLNIGGNKAVEIRRTERAPLSFRLESGGTAMTGKWRNVLFFIRYTPS